MSVAVPTAEVDRVGEAINMTFDSSVLFATGSADLSAQAKNDLADAATVFNKYDDTNILVEGHTDSRPISTARYPSNWELSTARATSVLRFLVEDAGLDGARLSAAGYADTRPIAEGDDPASLARNRRVEIVYQGQ